MFALPSSLCPVAAFGVRCQCVARSLLDRVPVRSVTVPFVATGEGVHSLHDVFQSADPSRAVGARGEPVTSMTSPTWENPKNHLASAVDRFTQPWDTLSGPCDRVDHGAVCTYSPVVVMATSQ